jgi:hypothetical protein
MKKPFAIVLVFALAIVLCRWLSRSTLPSPTLILAQAVNLAPSPLPLKTTTRSPATAVEAPRLPAAPLAPNGDARDPQENLDTAIADISRLVQANDFLTLFATYGAPIIDPTLRNRDGGNLRDGLRQNVQFFQQFIQSPGGQENLQHLQSVLEYIKTQTPVLDGTGDHATLQVGPMTDQLRAAGLYPQITFVKQDGRWYLQSGNPFGW